MHQNGKNPYQNMPPPSSIPRGQAAQSPRQIPPPPNQPMPPRGNTPTPPPQHNIRSAYRPKPVTPTANTAPKPLRKLIPTIGHDKAENRDPANTLVDKQTGRLMLLASLAFLVFYLLLVSSKLLNDRNNNKIQSYSQQQAQARSVAQQVSNALADNVAWIEHAILDGKNAQQAAQTIASSPKVSAVAILGNQNNLVAKFPDQADFLSHVSLKGIGTKNYQISSLIDKDGKITSMIIKKAGDYYAVVALNEHALLSLDETLPDAPKTALIAPSGRVIDGATGLGKTGPRDWFNLSPTEFEKITTSKAAIIEDLVIHGSKFRFISQPVPNSQLKLLQAMPSTEGEVFKENIYLFTVLFLGTCLLIGMLLNSLNKQLKTAREIQKQTEISQQRYQAAIESDSGGIWELDIPENSAYLSASLSALLGLPRREHNLQISQFLNMFHPNEREKFLSVARRSHVQGEFDIEVSVAHLPMILQCRGRPSTRSERNFKRVIVGVAVDITEQRRAQARLKAAEARLHSALSSMTDSFAVWDPKNRIVMWNVKFEEFFRLGPGTLNIGTDHASVEYLAKPAIAESFTSKENPGCRDIKLKDGRWIRYIETQTAEGGRVSVGTDVTEIRMREAELRENSAALKNTVDVLRKSQDRIFELAERYEQEKIRAEDASQSKTDFLASMSHELRTPLNAINGFSDIMKKEMFGPLGDPRYKEYISDILFSGQHLLTLINDILDMSKIEAGKMTLNTEVVFLHDMIAQVGRIIRGRADEAQLNLDISTQEVHEIEADPRAVKQILINLLTNAIKFTPEGGTVSVELVEKKSGIIIKVKDTGIGISEENIKRLAKPFEQVAGTENKLNEGTGLGLALSKSLIELHGGNFKIESKVGEGTTVIFSLPNEPIIKEEEPTTEDMSQEISRLAEDIANVLAEDEGKNIGANEAESLINPTPYPYQQPQVSPYLQAPDKSPSQKNERPAA